MHFFYQTRRINLVGNARLVVFVVLFVGIFTMYSGKCLSVQWKYCTNLLVMLKIKIISIAEKLSFYVTYFFGLNFNLRALRAILSGFFRGFN